MRRILLVLLSVLLLVSCIQDYHIPYSENYIAIMNGTGQSVRWRVWKVGDLKNGIYSMAPNTSEIDIDTIKGTDYILEIMVTKLRTGQTDILAVAVTTTTRRTEVILGYQNDSLTYRIEHKD